MFMAAPTHKPQPLSLASRTTSMPSLHQGALQLSAPLPGGRVNAAITRMLDGARLTSRLWSEDAQRSPGVTPGLWYPQSGALSSRRRLTRDTSPGSSHSSNVSGLIGAGARDRLLQRYADRALQGSHVPRTSLSMRQKSEVTSRRLQEHLVDEVADRLRRELGLLQGINDQQSTEGGDDVEYDINENRHLQVGKGQTNTDKSAENRYSQGEHISHARSPVKALPIHASPAVGGTKSTGAGDATTNNAGNTPTHINLSHGSRGAAERRVRQRRSGKGLTEQRLSSSLADVSSAGRSKDITSNGTHIDVVDGSGGRLGGEPQELIRVDYHDRLVPTDNPQVKAGVTTTGSSVSGDHRAVTTTNNNTINLSTPHNTAAQPQQSPSGITTTTLSSRKPTAGTRRSRSWRDANHSQPRRISAPGATLDGLKLEESVDTSTSTNTPGMRPANGDRPHPTEGGPASKMDPLYYHSDGANTPPPFSAVNGTYKSIPAGGRAHSTGGTPISGTSMSRTAEMIRDKRVPPMPSGPPPPPPRQKFLQGRGIGFAMEEEEAHRLMVDPDPGPPDKLNDSGVGVEEEKSRKTTQEVANTIDYEVVPEGMNKKHLPLLQNKRVFEKELAIRLEKKMGIEDRLLGDLRICMEKESMREKVESTIEAVQNVIRTNIFMKNGHRIYSILVDLGQFHRHVLHDVQGHTVTVQGTTFGDPETALTKEINIEFPESVIMEELSVRQVGPTVEMEVPFKRSELMSDLVNLVGKVNNEKKISAENGDDTKSNFSDQTSICSELNDLEIKPPELPISPPPPSPLIKEPKPMRRRRKSNLKDQNGSPLSHVTGSRNYDISSSTVNGNIERVKRSPVTKAPSLRSFRVQKEEEKERQKRASVNNRGIFVNVDTAHNGYKAESVSSIDSVYGSEDMDSMDEKWVVHRDGGRRLQQHVFEPIEKTESKVEMDEGFVTIRHVPVERPAVVKLENNTPVESAVLMPELTIQTQPIERIMASSSVPVQHAEVSQQGYMENSKSKDDAVQSQQPFMVFEPDTQSVDHNDISESCIHTKQPSVSSIVDDSKQTESGRGTLTSTLSISLSDDSQMNYDPENELGRHDKSHNSDVFDDGVQFESQSTTMVSNISIVTQNTDPDSSSYIAIEDPIHPAAKLPPLVVVEDTPLTSHFCSDSGTEVDIYPRRLFTSTPADTTLTPGWPTNPSHTPTLDPIVSQAQVISASTKGNSVSSISRGKVKGETNQVSESATVTGVSSKSIRTARHPGKSHLAETKVNPIAPGRKLQPLKSSRKDKESSVAADDISSSNKKSSFKLQLNSVKSQKHKANTSGDEKTEVSTNEPTLDLEDDVHKVYKATAQVKLSPSSAPLPWALPKPDRHNLVDNESKSGSTIDDYQGPELVSFSSILGQIIENTLDRKHSALLSKAVVWSEDGPDWDLHSTSDSGDENESSVKISDASEAVKEDDQRNNLTDIYSNQEESTQESDCNVVDKKKTQSKTQNNIRIRNVDYEDKEETKQKDNIIRTAVSKVKMETHNDSELQSGKSKSQEPTATGLSIKNVDITHCTKGSTYGNKTHSQSSANNAIDLSVETGAIRKTSEETTEESIPMVDTDVYYVRPKRRLRTDNRDTIVQDQFPKDKVVQNQLEQDTYVRPRRRRARPKSMEVVSGISVSTRHRSKDNSDLEITIEGAAQGHGELLKGSMGHETDFHEQDKHYSAKASTLSKDAAKNSLEKVCSDQANSDENQNRITTGHASQCDLSTIEGDQGNPNKHELNSTIESKSTGKLEGLRRKYRLGAGMVHSRDRDKTKRHTFSGNISDLRSDLQEKDNKPTGKSIVKSELIRDKDRVEKLRSMFEKLGSGQTSSGQRAMNRKLATESPLFSSSDTDRGGSENKPKYKTEFTVDI